MHALAYTLWLVGRCNFLSKILNGIVSVKKGGREEKRSNREKWAKEEKQFLDQFWALHSLSFFYFSLFFLFISINVFTQKDFTYSVQQ